MRRVGRATRGTGAPGRVSSLVLGRQLAYARELMKLNRAGDPVDLEARRGKTFQIVGGDSVRVRSAPRRFLGPARPRTRYAFEARRVGAP